MIQPLITTYVGKIKNIGLLLDRQHAFTSRKLYYKGAFEVGVVAWVSLTADSF
jgi:hypothetical protein